MQKQWGKHSLSVGHFGLVSRVLSASPKVDANGNPVPNLIDTRGPIDRFTDLGFDAQYQFIGKKHLLTAQTSYIHEDQRWNDSYSQGGTIGNAGWLDRYKINVNYYYRTDNWGSVGGTVAYVNSGETTIRFFTPLEPGPAAGPANPIATIGFLNWIISRGGSSLSPSSRCSTPPIATLMEHAVCTMGMPEALP